MSKKEIHLYTLIILYVLIKTNNNASAWFRKVGFCDWKKLPFLIFILKKPWKYILSVEHCFDNGTNLFHNKEVSLF